MNRSWIYRLTLTLVVFGALLLGTSGCAGGAARATSWTGLTVAGERLYFADLQQIAVIDAADGSVLWKFPADPKEEQLGSFYVTPAVDESHIIVASEIPARGFLSQPTYAVWAIDPESRRDLWHFDDATAPFIEGGAMGNGTFVIGNSDGYIYGLDVETGAKKWPPFRTEHRVWATPLIVDDTVYVGSMDRHLYALRLSDGKELWRFPAGGSMTDAGSVKGAFASAPVLRENMLYAGAFDDRVYAIDAATGRERWRFTGDNWFWGSPAVHDDVVYVVDVAGHVYALNADSGERVWDKPLDAPVRAGPAITEDGSKLLVGSENGTLYALDTSDGFVSWSREDEGQVLSAPVVDGSVVYESRVFGSFRLRALYVDNGRDIWTYPPPDEG